MIRPAWMDVLCRCGHVVETHDLPRCRGWHVTSTGTMRCKCREFRYWEIGDVAEQPERPYGGPYAGKVAS